jgi:uncharacterized coiled-coil DUF342 family protein
MTTEELNFEIEELRKQRRKLTDQVDEIDTEIIGYKEKLREIKIKNGKQF